jgi:hypothetical protein
MTKARRRPNDSRRRAGRADNSRARSGLRPHSSPVAAGRSCRWEIHDDGPAFTNCHGCSGHWPSECSASANLVSADASAELSRDPAFVPVARTVVGRVASSARRRALCFSRCAAFAGFPAEPPGRFSSSLPPLFASGRCAAILISRRRSEARAGTRRQAKGASARPPRAAAPEQGRAPPWGAVSGTPLTGDMTSSEGRKRAAAARGRSGARPRAPLGGCQRYSADWGHDVKRRAQARGRRARPLRSKAARPLGGLSAVLR